MHDARTEGEAKGRAEGEAKGKVAALLTVLEARGLVLTAEERDLIGQGADLDVLDRWLRRAVTVESARELFVGA